MACENETHVSGQAQYPSSIAITSGALPGDANQAFSTSTSSTPPCVQSTSGSGTTEQYILTCPLTSTPTASDAGSYPFTFTPTANGVTGPTSGTLTVNVANPTLTCTAPAAAGTNTTFNSSNGGTNNSFNVVCNGVSGETGLATYPTSIVPNTPANLPTDLVSATSTSSSPACTKSTSGSGTTEQYILTCPQTETAVSADNGSYSSTYTATDSISGATTTSGAWNLTVTGPSDVCTAPASGGTSTTFKAGIANTYSVSLLRHRIRLGQRRQLSVGHHRQYRLVAGRRHLPIGRGQPGLYHFDLRLGPYRAVHRHLHHHRDADGS